MRSPIIWYGGKGNFMKNLIHLIPKHECYVEAFGGGGSLLFAKPPSKVEIYNDVDSTLVDFFRLIQTDEGMESLRQRCQNIPYSRELYYEYRDSWKQQTDIVERVSQWFFVIRMSFGGGMGKSGWGSDRRRNRARRTSEVVNDFDKVSERLKHVAIDNRDWSDVVDAYDSTDTFFYLDPPYIIETRKNAMYDNEMSNDDHSNLIDKIKQIKGKVLLSGYDNAIYDSLNWYKQEIDFTCYISVGSNTDSKRVEVLWRNYDVQPTLF